MNKLNLKLICTLSIAIFSMFFGAGNTIYPLVLAIKAKSQFSWAFLGFSLTAILGPLLGLLGGALFRGSASNFFSQAGKYPGLILLTVSLGLLGPFAVLPRCISVSFAAIQTFIPSCSLWIFSGLFCLLALFCLFRKQMILTILGYFLSPALIFCLGLIVVKGILLKTPLLSGELLPSQAFSFGLLTGYETMDLVASIIFSAGIWSMVSEALSTKSNDLLKGTLITGGLACLLLGVIYFGLGYAAAIHSEALTGLPRQQLLPELARLTLGTNSAIVVNSLIALACFTTVVGLTMTLTQILSKEVFKGKLSYLWGISSILFLTFIMTGIGFETISFIIIKVLTPLYPLIIVLTVVNISKKLLQKRVKLLH